MELHLKVRAIDSGNDGHIYGLEIAMREFRFYHFDRMIDFLHGWLSCLGSEELTPVDIADKIPQNLFTLKQLPDMTYPVSFEFRVAR